MALKNCNRQQYEDSNVVLPGIRRVQFDAETVSSPTVHNVSLTLASTEVSFALPSGTKRFELQARNTTTLQLSYTIGASGTTYITIPHGAMYNEENLDVTASITLYLQAPVASSTVEILTWT